jgi:hypothetical protein
MATPESSSEDHTEEGKKSTLQIATIHTSFGGKPEREVGDKRS